MPLTQDPKGPKPLPYHDTGRRGKNVPRAVSYDSLVGKQGAQTRPKNYLKPKKKKKKQKTGTSRTGVSRAAKPMPPAKTLTQDPKRYLTPQRIRKD